MKITTITYMERKNKGNYEHEEISASANVDDGESFTDAMTSLKNAVHSILHGILIEVPKAEEIVPEVTVPAVKEKKTRAKKEIVEEVTAPAVIPEIKAAPKKALSIAYNSNIAEHKSILGGYLSKKYDTSWKTSHPAEEIKAFTASLNGKNFIDSEGHIVNSFLDLVHGFFGA